MVRERSTYSREQYLAAHYTLASLRKYRRLIPYQRQEEIRRVAMSGNVNGANALMNHTINEYYNSKKAKDEFPDEDGE